MRPEKTPGQWPKARRMSKRPTHYRDQQAWPDLQQLVPARHRLTDDSAPEEEFWNWRGHRAGQAGLEPALRRLGRLGRRLLGLPAVPRRAAHRAVAKAGYVRLTVAQGSGVLSICPMVR